MFIALTLRYIRQENHLTGKVRTILIPEKFRLCLQLVLLLDNRLYTFVNLMQIYVAKVQITSYIVTKHTPETSRSTKGT